MQRMRKQRKMRLSAGALVAALAALGLSTGASAQYEQFQFCPYENPAVFKCLHSTTEGGEVVLGKKTVPIVNPAVVQGGYGEADETSLVSEFFGATNEETLSRAPQPVPGGLLGLVPPESSPPLVKELVEAVAENGLTGVNSTLELARPADEIQVSEFALGGEEGTALRLPVKVKLENPFLGSNCYVGSSKDPIVWNLSTGVTDPPPPNEPIDGTAGEIEFVDEGLIVQLNGMVLVDNAWSAPGASGCGGLLAPLVDPVIDSQVGLPAPAGSNTAVLAGTSAIVLAETVKEKLGG